MKKLLLALRGDTFKSFIHTFVTDLLWETGVAAALTHILSNGDFSKTALSALGYAVFRTLLRDVREFMKKRYPKLKEVRKN